jgi:hypothetical protein
MIPSEPLEAWWRSTGPKFLSGRQQLFRSREIREDPYHWRCQVIDRGTNQTKPRRKRAKYLDTGLDVSVCAIEQPAASIKPCAGQRRSNDAAPTGTDRIPGSPIIGDPRTVGKMAGHIVLP